MPIRVKYTSRSLICISILFPAIAAWAGPVYQPAGANLTYGDVTHGQRVQSASGNPAAAAADIDRGTRKGTRGTVLSVAAGLEYGNIQDLFDFYDKSTRAYKPSDPGTGGGPGQLPEDKPDGGIDLGDIWDSLNPDFQESVEAVATEVATQAVILALIKEEGYGKAWVAADAPFVVGNKYLGGTWTYGVNWSGASKAYGIVQPIEFDQDAAREAWEDWFNQALIDRPVQFSVDDQVLLSIDPTTDSIAYALENDSSLISKSTQTTELSIGYSRLAWSNHSGSLFLGVEASLYMMRLSRLSVRFGDITDSEELFDAIRNSDFSNDERLGVDIGALWVGGNYQLGAQLTNINQPNYTFPDVDLRPYANDRIIRSILKDKTYEMDRQLKLEASLFTSDRRWSVHLGLDADPATDPMGDDYQWATVSAGLVTDSWWIPSARIGFRKNLAGTKMQYLSAGVTAFKILNIDLASALDTVSIDGHKLPQSLMISIGLQLTW